MKLYAYCIAEDLDQVNESVRGISGGRVRLETIDDLSVIVSDLNSDTVPVTRENALSHAAVVRSVLDRTTPLPFRFGTVLSVEQLRSYISSRKSALETNLALVRGCVEMSVKIIWDVSNHNDTQQHEARGEEDGAGATFLKEKQREIRGSERRAKQAEEISGWLHDGVTSLTRDEKVTLRPAEKLFFVAAHLVERARLQQYRERMAKAVSDRPDLRFLLSGPWPPYSFANVELEFKTHFGVS